MVCTIKAQVCVYRTDVYQVRIKQGVRQLQTYWNKKKVDFVDNSQPRFESDGKLFNQNCTTAHVCVRVVGRWLWQPN